MADDPSTPIRLLSGLLDAQAARRPHADALTDGRVRLDWAAYADRCARFAGTLTALGVRIGDRVAVHLPKSVDSFVSVHAIIRVGAIVVPVDWLAPPDYARSVLELSGATTLISSARPDQLDAIVAGTSVRATIDPLADSAAFDATATPAADVDPETPAYIIFTSGSTGRPKGIVHTHASGLAYARLAVATYGITPADRMANIAPIHFDQSTFELYGGPLAGAAVLVVPDGAMRFPASMSKLLADERITVWYSVPFAARQLSDRGALDDRDLSALRWMLFGGENFPAAALARLMHQLPHTRFSNVYGPAEVNQCTYFHLDAPPDRESSIPIGRAWPETSLAIVEDDTVVAGPGRGELWVSSPTMMREYWGDPELTRAGIQERSDLGSGRWYRTGDVVERRDDGELVFVGRTDHQVKVRGHRVELEAVESAIGAHPSVDACLATVDDEGNLVALAEPADLDVADVTRHVRSLVPAAAVPGRLIAVDSLPRTGSGKVDRTAARRLLTESDPPSSPPSSPDDAR